MPNRILKESICYSADIDRLTPFEETVFYRILVRADDYGNLDGRSDFLKSVLFTTKPGVGVKRIEDACRKLEELGMLQKYEVEGKPYYNIVNWAKHQRVRISKHKVPPLAEICGESRQVAASCGELPPESQSESQSQSESESQSQLPDLFERFWNAYPKKIGRREALEAFCELKPDARKVGLLVGAVERMKCSEAWCKENGRYIPKAEKWLREEQWNECRGGVEYGTVLL